MNSAATSWNVSYDRKDRRLDSHVLLFAAQVMETHLYSIVMACASAIGFVTGPTGFFFEERDSSSSNCLYLLYPVFSFFPRFDLFLFGVLVPSRILFLLVLFDLLLAFVASRRSVFLLLHVPFVFGLRLRPATVEGRQLRFLEQKAAVSTSLS